jgi:hypothetical protein
MRIGEATNRKDLLQACEEARKRRLEKRRAFETTWWNNLALLSGDHFTEWNPMRGELIQMMPTENKVRMVINHALATARTELAKLSKSRPIMTVMANSNESVDIAATKVALTVLDSLEWKFGLPKVRKNALWWMIAGGVSAIYIGWDPTETKDGHVDFIVDPGTNEPVFEKHELDALKALVEAGELDEMPQESWPLGDLEYKVYSAFMLLPDETAVDFREIKDLITTDVVDIDEAESIWGRPVRSLSPEKTNLGTLGRRLIAKLNMPQTQTSDVDNGLNVHTFWLLPGRYSHNEFLKDGVMLRWAQDTELEFSERYPFKDNRIPFAFFQHIPTNTSIWPDSILQHIRDPNLEIDKIMSQMIEAKDHMANPMWRIATQHQIVGKIKNQPGGQIKYVHVRDIPPPEPIPGIGVPQQVEEIMMQLRQAILEISGQSEPTRGRMPQGVRSGVQIAYMQEEDDSKIAPTVEDMEWAVATMCSLSLSRVDQFYTIDRTLRVYRRNGVFDVRKFKNANLRGTTDVIPLAGSGMPKSKAARQQYMLELAQLGLITDPRQLMEALEVGQGEPTETEKDYAQAERENQTMLYGLRQDEFAEKHARLPKGGEEGQPTAIPVKEWHNHEVHLERHYSLMKDEEFERLMEESPEIVRLFDEHVAQHQEILQQRAQAQMEAMQAAKGAPDGPPGAASQPGATSRRHMGNMDVPDVIGGGALDLQTQTLRQTQ